MNAVAAVRGREGGRPPGGTLNGTAFEGRKFGMLAFYWNMLA